MHAVEKNDNFIFPSLAFVRTGLPDGTYIWKPKIPILVLFGGPWNGKYWNIFVHLE
jgi:hypothetical protein